MSIVQLNIRTRIELETRVLAAALKQSFERGDSDGVSLAHRQLFLLLKDQKSGNGGSTQSETATVQPDHPTSATVDADEAHVNVSAAFAEPELPTVEAPRDTSPFDRSTQEVEGDAEAEADAGQSADELELTEVEEAEQSVQFDHEGAAEHELDEVAFAHDQAPEQEVAFAHDQAAEQEVEFAHDQAPEQEVAFAQDQAPEQEIAIAHDQTSEQEFATAYDQAPEQEVATAYDQAIEQEVANAYDEAPEQEDATAYQAAEQEFAIENESTSQEFVLDQKQSTDREFTTPKDEIIRPFAKVNEERSDTDAKLAEENRRYESEQAQAIAQYLKYKQTRDQLATESSTMSDKFQIPTTTPAPSDVSPSSESNPDQTALSEEDQYVRMRKPPPAAKVELPFDHPSEEYAKVFGGGYSQPDPAQEKFEHPAQSPASSAFPPPPMPQSGAPNPSSVTGSPLSSTSSAMPGSTPGPFDALIEPPSFAGTYAKSNDHTVTGERPIHDPDRAEPVIYEIDNAAQVGEMGTRIESFDTFEPEAENPQSRHDLPDSATEQANEIPPANDEALPDSSSQDISEPPEQSAQADQDRPQNATQDLPNLAAQFATPEQIAAQLEEFRNRQAAEYAARKANQSMPRNMPAIDFSLQSESNKPDIDFSLSSESKGPDIDFTTTPKSVKPDIDFSLQSETSNSRGPDIDFSLESEKRESDAVISAPTGGGLIEAEFVTKETENDEFNQDVTSELPVLNPAASLYLNSVDEQGSTDNPTRTQGDNSSAPPDMVPPSQTNAIGIVQANELPQPQPARQVPYTGIPLLAPMHNAPPVVPPPQPVLSHAAETTGQEEPLPSTPKPPDLYALLGVSQMSPFEEIHKNFLRKIRKILRRLKGAVRPERDELLKDLRRHWVARDILCDPVTRTDYDFRDMGLRGSPDGQVPVTPDEGTQRIGQRTPLRIGELLQCAGLLEMAELEIACDMHKAMPEVQFGTFLVRQGFIQERDLDSVLLGQNLLRDGKITVAQFQVAMELSQSRGANISDTLIEHGYITAAELAQITGNAEDAQQVPELDVPKIKEVPVKPRSVEQPSQSNLTTSSAVPTWKDQLDWSKPLSDEDDASLVGRDPEKQSLAELLGNVNTEAPPTSEPVKISNNAAPSWKDQLDWEKPEEPIIEAQPDAVPVSGQDMSPGQEDVNRGQDMSLGQDVNRGQDMSRGQEDSPASLSLSNAVPSWKDQLDWESPKDEPAQQTDVAPAPPDAALNQSSPSTDSGEHETVDEGGHPPEEKEGFFKKSLGKLKKDSKDKKKKRK